MIAKIFCEPDGIVANRQRVSKIVVSDVKPNPTTYTFEHVYSAKHDTINGVLTFEDLLGGIHEYHDVHVEVITHVTDKTKFS
jgi:hypothetical protein